MGYFLKYKIEKIPSETNLDEILKKSHIVILFLIFASQRTN